MYTPPVVSPQDTPRSESQASEEEEEEEEEEDEEEDGDEASQDAADLGFGVGVVLSAVASEAAAMAADESTETADRSTTTTTTTTTPNTNPTVATTDAAAAVAAATAAAASTDDPSAAVIVSALNLDAWKASYREVAHTSAAVCWELSSSKPGNGVEQLRDSSTETYWQSDGTTQPHWVQITFRRRLPICFVALYLDIQLDESYTPKTLSVETGMTAQDLSASAANVKMELTDPSGWSVIAISGPPDPITMDTTIKTHMIRINILSMHQNGRDTHIRRLAVFAKRTPTTSLSSQQSLLQQRPLTDHFVQQQRNMQGKQARKRQDNGDDDDDNDDTNLMLNSEFGGPFSMLIR